MVKKVPLQNGEFVLVDDEDYERVMQHKWVRTVSGRNNTNLIVYGTVCGQSLRLSKFIVGDKVKEGMVVSLKNDNPLDFRKENLIVTEKESLKYKRKGSSKSTSKYRGVSWDKRAGKWVAQINVNRKVKKIGSYKSEDEAAKAYNVEAIKAWGLDAFQNKIGKSNRAESHKKDLTKRPNRLSCNKTGYRGVTFDKNLNSYYAKLTYQKKRYLSKYFKTPEEAAEWHDRKAYEIYGDKAILNFPEKISEYEKEELT